MNRLCHKEYVMNRLIILACLLLMLASCARNNRAYLPDYEPQVIDSLEELESITRVYAEPLNRFALAPTPANFSRQFPGHHRLPNQGQRHRYQIYLDQRYVLKRDDNMVDGANWLIFLYNLFKHDRYDNQDYLETSPRLYRQYLTFEWEEERYLGYQLAERHCTSDRVNTMNCEY